MTEAGWAIRVALAQLRATTPAGFAAKAWVVRQFCNVDGGRYFDPHDDAAVAWSLAGDLLGLPAEKMPTTGC